METFDFKNLNPSVYVDEEKIQINYLLERMEKQLLTNNEYRYLQYLLMKNEDLYKSNYSDSSPYPLCKMGVTSDKIMFISDTHRGNSAIESKQIIELAYNEALRQNIRAVVHAGDFIEACPANFNKRFDVVLKELETAKADLPNEIKTGLLLGNHDYSAIRTYHQIIPYYFDSPKIEILGMQKVLLYWNGPDIIRINHPISQLKEPSEENQSEIITLEGHHHYYDFKEDFRTINIPSLSIDATRVYDQRLCEKNLRFICPFIIGEKQGDNLLFYKYCIDKSLTGKLYATEVVEANTKTKQLKLRTII